MKLTPRKRVFILVGLLAIPFLGFIYFFKKPRVLAVHEVPIAYWAWRTNAPDPVDVEKAFKVTNAKTLFVRSGQFDFDGADIRRIRPAEGTLPPWVEIHLVYNATPDLLKELETLDTGVFARAIAETYKADLVRSRNESAQVFGLQLDLDFPNRLLPKYAMLLQELRSALPPDTKLSITGLPAWMASKNLTTVLGFVDFWTPQCYGGSIPKRIGQRIPISSVSEVVGAMSKARSLGKPFYAGLSDYSYALLYGADGKLLDIRGNIDPSEVAQHGALEQVDKNEFADSPGEMRYEYLAQKNVVLNGLTVKAGQSVVLDVPSSESLRSTARAVRENAGERLLGISIFRMPSSTDRSALTIDEVRRALEDEPPIAINSSPAVR